MKHNTSVNNSVNKCMKCFVLSPLMLCWLTAALLITRHMTSPSTTYSRWRCRHSSVEQLAS